MDGPLDARKERQNVIQIRNPAPDAPDHSHFPVASGGATRGEKLAGKKLYVFDRIGCATSRVNIQRYVDFMVTHGTALTLNVNEADIVLLDTCAFDQKAEQESLDNIKNQQSRAKEGARVIVCGCLAGINPARLQQEFHGEFFSPRNEAALATILDLDDEDKKFLSPSEARGRFVGRADIQKNLWRKRVIFRCLETVHALNEKTGLEWVPVLKGFLSAHQHANPRAYAVNISQGCLGTCTFCVIPMAKGSTRSLSAGLIIEKIRGAVRAGAHRIILTSEDTGAYGKDIKGTVVDLLQRIHEIPGDFSIYIGFFDPRWLPRYTDALKPIFAQGKVKYLQLPLQSGSSSVLARMKRAYSAELVMPYIRDLKTSFPSLTLGSQFIAGFPGETEEEFENTRAIVREGLFGYNDVFAFSDRPRAQTNTMPGHLPRAIVQKRVRVLRRDWYRSLVRGAFR